MSADATAFAVLGLKPGADRATVEAAYKRLIKRYHPDRDGGDSDRAAQINRAYFELRGRPALDGRDERPAGIGEAIYARRARPLRKVRRRRRLWPPLLALALLATGIAERKQIAAWVERSSNRLDQLVAPLPGPAATGTSQRARDIETPLAERAISSSIAEARRLTGGQGRNAVEERSRECHGQLREAPDAELLDRCAAFDIAVVAITQSDPMRDDGPFSASAVTARQMTAARLLSDDYNAIEVRLDQIRSRVELGLTPPPPQLAEPVPPDQAVLNPREGRLAD
ncbi:MAG: J domain-containing protein [Pseudomonadota bacterium]|nr:J domain-containing protein [Pseudomonadota bacterium]